MRGRTNVMQRKEPTINGLVKNFRVATGNTIVKGDFVSYKAGDSEQTFSLNYLDKKIYDESNFLSLVQTKESNSSYFLRLIKTVSAIEIKDSIEFTTKVFYDYDDDYIYVGTGTSLQVYSIVNDEFVLVDETTTTYNIVGVTKTDEQDHIGVLTNNSTYLIIQRVTVSNGVVTLGQEYTGQYPTAGNNWETYSRLSTGCEFGYISDDYFGCWCIRKNASNYSYGYVVFWLFDFDGTVFNMTSTETYYSHDLNQILRAEFYNGLMVLNKEQNKMFFYRINTEGQLVEVYSKPSSNFAPVASFISSKYILSFTYGISSAGYVLYEWNKETGLITVGVLLTTSRTNLVYCMQMEDNQIVYYDYGSTVRAFIYDPSTLTLVAGRFTGEVESYNGGFTVGFAKTGGVAGDTIQVYTPQSVS